MPLKGKRISKKDVCLAIVKDTTLVYQDVHLMLGSLLRLSAEYLARGERIDWRGFGTFSVITRRAGLGRKGRKGPSIWMPAYKRVKFTTCKPLKDRINNRHRLTSPASQPDTPGEAAHTPCTKPASQSLPQ